MKKRTITVKVEFDMSEFSDEDVITSKDKVKKMVEEQMLDIFCWDEGFEKLEVKVEDE